MALLVETCPRCSSTSMTFDVRAQLYVAEEFDWVRHYEGFCICRNCRRSTTFRIHLTDYEARATFYPDGGLVAYNGSLNQYFAVDGYLNLAVMATVSPPEHVPDEIAAAFKEASVCLAVGCFNAAGAMFRLCVDLATRPLLPKPEETTAAQPNGKQRRDLGLRLRWLFENDQLAKALEELAGCIREDAKRRKVSHAVFSFAPSMRCRIVSSVSADCGSVTKVRTSRTKAHI